jgi:uncharacterized protein
MLFVLHATDHAGALPKRLAHYEAHKAYLEAADAAGPVRIVMSGPLVEDDGSTMRGSMFLLDAPSREAVLAFHEADPFKAAGLWAQVSISAFLRRRG